MDAMKLHTVFITYNRLELTKRAIASYIETVTVPWTAWIVDNHSEDGTREFILEGSGMQAWPLGSGASILNENRYPGFACNLGFDMAPADATHLHRADNDFVFLPGWCDEVAPMFRRKSLGQLGLRTNKEEMSGINVGGNCVIRRSLWDDGLRWDERPWPQLRDEVGAGWTEDSLMSGSVRKMGYTWARVKNPCIQPISNDSADDPYYQGTWEDRGISEDFGK
jgi:glycosyltransferase involved in cell wall biosynthesis